MSIPPSPASSAKKPSSGDQVLALKREEQKRREAEQRLAEEQQSMLGLQAEVGAMSPDEEMVTNDSSIVDAQINIQVMRAAQAMEARCPESPRLLGCHLPLD